jgi:hypothetical protein
MVGPMAATRSSVGAEASGSRASTYRAKPRPTTWLATSVARKRASGSSSSPAAWTRPVRIVLVTNSRSMATPWSVVAAARSSPRKAVLMSATSQIRSIVPVRISPTRRPNSGPSRSRSAPRTFVMISLGTTGSRIAAANKCSLVP